MGSFENEGIRKVLASFSAVFRRVLPDCCKRNSGRYHAGLPEAFEGAEEID
jgi:hypothetical protein